MPNTTSNTLFDPTAVFVSEQTTQEGVFKEVSDKLLEMKYVKPEFLKNLAEREKNYPTGIDMSVVNPDYPNIAIPHTEGNFVNVRMIVPIKLAHPVEFGNMIDPSQHFQVSFLFMILNNDPDGQANVLSEIMGFLTTTPAEDLQNFLGETNKAAIYSFLNTYFNQD
ncbi:PTS sugar transporter subunit IIA [Lacticaseibacillus songhuajiangensis]|jgi:PTS system galactitol-specific IIA component|uniref:PTS sugar transporter subunit IIA n=1 Tax=Lacticaseibacillus songhuajiangensis TaxID=1296539 RepID=UPI000F7B7710|nr:PTS sugar transporter subunit IIA [Lacticaseibacillus songhuajiangensis]